jgi:hypothetical protein
VLLKHEGLCPVALKASLWNWAAKSQIAINTTGSLFKRNRFVFDADGEAVTIDRNDDRPNIEDEISLQELTASSEEIFGYASHLSPETYSGIEPLVYNKLKEAFASGQTKRIHDVFNIVLMELKDGIKNYEQRTGKG